MNDQDTTQQAAPQGEKGVDLDARSAADQGNEYGVEEMAQPSQPQTSSDDNEQTGQNA